jgi:photosystem II stability/assembly factor-like uncharacterized protein
MSKVIRLVLVFILFATYVRADETSPNGPYFEDVLFVDAQRGYSIGLTPDNGWAVFKTINSGESWRTVYKTSSAKLSGLAFTDAEIGWVVGTGGTILSTRDGGNTWAAAKAGTIEDLSAVTCSPVGLVLTVGKRGTLLVSRDQGTTWTKMPLPTLVDFTDVLYLPAGTLLVLGRDRLLTSADSGASWVVHGPFKWVTLRAMSFSNEREGFLLSGALLYSKDGGWHLDVVPLPTSDIRTAVCMTKAGTLYVITGAAATGSSVRMLGDKFPSRSAILKSTDMGRSWQQIFSSKDDQTHRAFLTKIFFLDEGHGWAVGGDGTVVYTTDGGRNWSQSQVVRDR